MNMRVSASIVIPNAKKIFFDLFKEYEESSERSSISLKKEGKNVIITIDTHDSVAMRASFNSISKLITVYEKTEGLVENGKRN